MRNFYGDDLVTCPKCENDAYELEMIKPTDNPVNGQQYAWPTKLSCGCTVNQYLVWYDEVGWV